MKNKKKRMENFPLSATLKNALFHRLFFEDNLELNSIDTTVKSGKSSTILRQRAQIQTKGSVFLIQDSTHSTAAMM